MDQDVDSRIQALEEQIARLSANTFRSVTSFTARNPFFVSAKAFDHRNMKDRTRSIFVPLFSATIRTNTPAITVSGSNTRYRAWAFDAAQTEEILCEGFMPTDFQYRAIQVTPVLWHTNLGAGSGNAVWQVTLIPVNDTTLSSGANSNLNTTSGEVVVTSTIAAPVQNELSISSLSTTVSPTALAASRSMIRIGVARLGADGSDTLANDAGLVAVELRYTADM